MTEYSPTILLIDTADTKGPELRYLSGAIASAGGSALVMDVGVLREPDFPVDVTNEEVAEASGSTRKEVIALQNEDKAMTAMARGDAALASQLFTSGRIDGMLAFGGTMGTDLALDVALALPVGVPKTIISSVSCSQFIPPERIAADLTMIQWAAGLWGLNEISKFVLAQADGAAVGAARQSFVPDFKRPAVAVSSLGSSGLNYMKWILPGLEDRGYDVPVFHAVGMGGREMEAMISQGRFAAVLDLALIEVTDHVLGSVVSAGPNRIETAGKMGLPQIIAPGAIDALDFASWQDAPGGSTDNHQYNRLIFATRLTHEQRRKGARAVVEKAMASNGPTAFILPLKGVDEWDRPGQPMHDAEGLEQQIAVFREGILPPVDLVEVDSHINDREFAAAVLRVFDAMVADGHIPHAR